MFEVGVQRGRQRTPHPSTTPLLPETGSAHRTPQCASDLGVRRACLCGVWCQIYRPSIPHSAPCTPQFPSNYCKYFPTSNPFPALDMANTSFRALFLYNFGLEDLVKRTCSSSDGTSRWQACSHYDAQLHKIKQH